MISLDDVEAVIFARVSDDRDGRSRSTKQQVSAAKKWCARYKIPIAKIVVEEDIGASRYSKKKRTAYEQVLTEDLKPVNGKRRVLVSWESSRAQRNLEVYVRLRKVCEEHGALWCYNDRVYDMSDPDDRRRTAQDAVDDEYEVERTRKRILRDMEETRALGRPHGKLAYGYRIVRDARTGKSERREPDEETAESIKEGRVATAPIVREIARRLLAGEKAYSIAADLNSRGIEAPRPKRDGSPGVWRARSIIRMAASPTYAGLRVDRGAVIGKGTWEPILSQKDHDRLVALASKTDRLTHRGTKPRWLLTGIATCGVCGAPVGVFKGRGYHSYVCKAGFCVGRAVIPLDRLVEEAILERLESPDVFQVLTADDEEAEAAFEEARVLQARLDEFVAQAADPVNPISAKALAQIEARLRPQIAAAERRGRAALKSPLVAEVAGVGARKKWKRLEMEQRREVVRALAHVRIDKATQGARFTPRRIALWWVGEPDPGELVIVPLVQGGDPMDFSEREVLLYLREADFQERVRVVTAERAGLGRGKILRLSVDPALARAADWRRSS